MSTPLFESEDSLSAELYSSHKDQFSAAQPPESRLDNIALALKSAFDKHIAERLSPYVLFEDITVEELAEAFHGYPIIIKPILTCVNVASRAIERDLSLKIDTYGKRIARTTAYALAGYIKPLLPKEISIDSLLELDRFFWVDKSLRASKGNWEATILSSLNHLSNIIFKKRKFSSAGEKFELDAAYPILGIPIEFGIDIKRIESPRDIHKRIDEIVNKASKFKREYPNGKFAAFIYYPFPSQQINIHTRLADSVDYIYFASESTTSIATAAGLFLAAIGKVK